MSETVKVQNRRGGVIHISVNGTPDCDPWQNKMKFKVVSYEVTCKRCLAHQV